jgi:hypothetical protein
MEFFFNDNLFKIIAIVTSLIAAVIGTLKGVIKFKDSSSSLRRKERENLMKIIQELDLLKLDEDFKKSIIDEYKRLVIKETKGLNMAYFKYKAIIDAGLLNKYSNSQIKIANGYFEYPESGLGVKVPWYEKAISIFYSVLAFSLIGLGSAVLIMALDDSHNLLRYFLLIGFSILTTLFSFFTISTYVAPVNVALMIKKDIEKNKQTK